MLLSEPPASPYDVRFSLFGIPVRVHPMFWLVGVLFGLNNREIVGLLLWVAALFSAILVHELGHALVMRRFGFRPWITLYGMGGLTARDSRLSSARANTWFHEVLISLAGVGAGFLLSWVVIGVFIALGHSVAFYAGMGTTWSAQFSLASGWESGIMRNISFSGLYIQISNGLEGIKSSPLEIFFSKFLYICLIWGLVNLLPVYPLDGGQVSRELFLRFNPWEGIRRSLILSTATAAFISASSLMVLIHGARQAHAAGQASGNPMQSASLYVAIFFGYLAYGSYTTLQVYGGRWRR